MDKTLRWFREYRIVLAFAAAKLLVHLLTATHYGLHRDAYLYLAESNHLDWGYFSTPPLTAFVTRIHTFLWGDSVWAVRLLPALISTAALFLTGWFIRQLKGGTMAQIVGLTAYFMSPAYLRPGVLLQPIIFNHLFWLVAAVVVFQLIRRQEPRILLWMIPVLGLGWLAKYSIVFYGSGLLAGMVICRHRKLLWSLYLPLAILGGLVVIAPNLYWQYQQHFPVFSHMAQLKESQLGNVLFKDFIIAQFMMHLPALPVWLAGLIWLVFNKEHRQFRVYAWAFGLTLLFILLLHGKFYYTIAAYTVLVVFGALAWERWSQKAGRWVGIAVTALILSNGLFALPFSLPVFKPERMIAYDTKMRNLGMEVLLKWEDGEVHDLPQDYADMVGWDELGKKVWAFFDTLDDSVRSSTLVYGEHYGIAGSVLYYRPDDSYPEVYSFNDAFMEWVPRVPEGKYLIYIGYSDRLPTYFDHLELVGTVEHPHFRERGLPIWFGSHPTEKLYQDWEETWQETKGRFSR